MSALILLTLLVFFAPDGVVVAQTGPEAKASAVEEAAPEPASSKAEDTEAKGATSPGAAEPVAEGAAPERIRLDEKDRAVLAVVARMYVGPAFGTPLVLQAETSTTTPAYREPNPWIVRGAYRFNSALLNFQSRNAESLNLEQAPAVNTPAELLSQAELKELAGTGEGSKFKDRFPQSSGYLVLSMPGYDSRQRRAFVYAAYYCGDKCTDGGKYFFLNDTKDGWVVDRVVTAWWGKPEPPTQASRRFKP